jgi:tetratricopeptide (TPR) repeat protein
VPLYQRSLAIWESVMGPDNPDLAATLDNLAVLYAKQGKFDEADPLYKRSLALREKSAVLSLNNRALVLELTGEESSAEREYKLAIGIAEKIPALAGAESVGETALLKQTLESYAVLLRKLKRVAEAVKVEARAKSLGGGGA